MTGAADRVADLVKTSLEMGASIARSALAATTSGEAEARPPDDTAWGDVVTIGTAAAGTLAKYAVDAARMMGSFAAAVVPSGAAREASATTRASSGSAAPTPSRPRITQGAILRVPLLVENTGADPTGPLDFAATAVVRVSGDEGPGIGVDRVTFAPETLTVGARDFEKLTVRIHTAADTGCGIYRATVTGGSGWFSTEVEFEVTDALG